MKYRKTLNVRSGLTLFQGPFFFILFVCFFFWGGENTYLVGDCIRKWVYIRYKCKRKQRANGGVRCKLSFIIMKSAFLCLRDSRSINVNSEYVDHFSIACDDRRLWDFIFRILGLLLFLVFILQLPTLSLILFSTFLCLFYLLQLPILLVDQP